MRFGKEHMAKTKRLTLRQVEEALEEPAHLWFGRCFEISFRIVEKCKVAGTAVYGHWLGPIAPGTLFDRGGPFARHGWVSLKAGGVLDPTRFVFEDVKPYLYYGPDGPEYDEGGNEWLSVHMQPPPKFEPRTKQLYLGSYLIDDETWSWIAQMLQINTRQQRKRNISIDQAFWLANLPLTVLGEHAAYIYRAFKAAGREALVPIDNYRRVQEERWNP
jgi:hypothetical protein